jgi:hypothetical protein
MHGNNPTNLPREINQDKLMETALQKHAEESQVKYNSIINSDSTNSSFWPDNNLFEKLTPENLINYFLNSFKSSSVEGYLDDLLGLHLFIHILLLIIVTGLIILFSIYLIIQNVFKNKEFILKRFKNKYIILFIKYQILLSKISQIILPLLLMFGLIELFVGLFYLISHPIPYEKLPIDLHIYIKNDKTLV